MITEYWFIFYSQLFCPFLHWFCVYHYGDSQFGKRADSVLLSSATLLPSPSAILFEFLKIETFIILDGRDETRLMRCLGSLFSIHSSSWILLSNKFSPTTWIMMMTETGQDKTRQATEPWKEYRNKQSEIEGCLYDNDSTTPLWVTNWSIRTRKR